MKIILLVMTLMISLQARAQTVIAHYIPHLAAYGTTVAGYEQDIRDAQSAGVDGFVLDEFGWGAGTTPYANFQTLTANMFQAAVNLGTGFKLFLMSDCQGKPWCASAAGQMLTAYGNHPNYMRLQGRPLFGGWSSNLNSTVGSADDSGWSAVIGSIRATGLNPLFMPTFSNWTISYANTEAWFANGWLNGKVQGLMSGGDYVSSMAIENNQSYDTVTTNHGITFAAAVESWHAPIRFLSTGQTAQVAALEFNGGEGLSAIWQDLITTVHPDMVYLVSWNDYSESYMGPASQASLTANNISSWQVTGDYLFTHAAYTDLNRYFIQWYKTGAPPSWPDAMYVFYRNASTKMVATKAPRNTSIAWNQEGVTTLDDVYVTTILTAPATLLIDTGSSVKQVTLPAGLKHTRMPFKVGKQTFTLSRGGASIIRINGADVVSSEPYYYNVNPMSYYGHHP